MDKPRPHLQVFICFHSKDVRDNIFSFIKDWLIEKGVNVRTDEDAPRGRPIGENLLNLIRDSKIAVVIFSENFPSSDWCLDELVEIKNQMDSKKLEPLPLFFEVETSHVKLEGDNPFKDILLRLENTEREKARKESKEALEEAEKRFLSWREALKSVAGRMGLIHKKNSPQSVYVRGIIEAVKEMLANVPSSNGVPQYQVYISFQGSDSSHKFSAFLKDGLKRSGINVYADVENATEREDIGKLFIGIQESRIALVIFSENYMSSALCLEELVEISKYMRMESLVPIPIFYRTDSGTGEFLFFEQLVKNWGITDARIVRWNKALSSVAMMRGLVSTPQRSDAELIEKIIQETMKVLVNTSSNEREFHSLTELQNFPRKNSWKVFATNCSRKSTWKMFTTDFSHKTYDQCWWRKIHGKVSMENIGEKSKENIRLYSYGKTRGGNEVMRNQCGRYMGEKTRVFVHAQSFELKASTCSLCLPFV